MPPSSIIHILSKNDPSLLKTLDAHLVHHVRLPVFAILPLSLIFPAPPWEVALLASGGGHRIYREGANSESETNSMVMLAAAVGIMFPGASISVFSTGYWPFHDQLVLLGL